VQIHAALAGLRLDLARRIKAVLPGQTGAIAVALIIGIQSEVDENTLNAMRASGLAHVLSVSGLHMTLVAGSVYWLVRWLLALIPALALRFSIKAWAAITALAAATAYLGLSGAAVATERSYVMIAIVFLAVILNRPALSLRNVALAALLILVAMPESLLDASFQMSFAATAALIAAYESFGRYLRYEGRGLADKLTMQPLMFIAGSLATTLVASLATAPFSAFHFHNAAIYSSLGNLLAMPAVSILIMPMAALALAAMPFGLEDWPLRVMGLGIDIMNAIAHFVASFDRALTIVPAFPAAALALMTLGGLWLMIWRGRWRYAGLGLFALGLAATAWRSPPDILVEGQGRIIAIRNAQDGGLAAPKSRKGRYALEQWLKADGDSREPKDAAAGKGFQCDLSACLALVKGALVSFAVRPDALAQDCSRAAILIAPLDIGGPCSGPRLIVDKRTLKEHGAHSIRIGPGGALEVETASALRGVRPWSPLQPAKRRIEPQAAPPPGQNDETDAEEPQ
jgi:competence protein ComEC